MKVTRYMRCFFPIFWCSQPRSWSSTSWFTQIWLLKIWKFKHPHIFLSTHLNHAQKYGDIIRFFWGKKSYFGDFSKTNIEFATKKISKFSQQCEISHTKELAEVVAFKQTLTLNIVRFHIFYMDGDGEIINNPVREYARNRYLDALLLVK